MKFLRFFTNFHSRYFKIFQVMNWLNHVCDWLNDVPLCNMFQENSWIHNLATLATEKSQRLPWCNQSYFDCLKIKWNAKTGIKLHPLATCGQNISTFIFSRLRFVSSATENRKCAPSHTFNVMVKGVKSLLSINELRCRWIIYSLKA